MLDDWLLQAPSKQIFFEQSKQLVALVQDLAWVINYKKSEVVLTQCFDFLGYKLT